ncbi:uncharacterized protein LOC116051016 isoform X1 [Sander lucioperca]|uniref:uncharacterized protein LOC116051016 isoform X1 n=1 Tax=Sander lucioperca TaxID=283035 RepID=UPI00125CDC85|nr:uncharacterized protein LOC116051016 isoform X1 [Sander lucioperca]
MPYCCAFGCKERQGRGKRFHKFPREPKRRKVWELKVKRANWKANDYSILCEDHFEEAAYETGRVDGLRRLRSTAVPTQFVFTPRKLPGRTTKRSRRTEGEPCVGGQEHIQIDHSYCSTSCAPSFEVQTDIQVGHEEFDLRNNACTGGTVSSEPIGEDLVSRDTVSDEAVSGETAGRKSVSRGTARGEEELNALKNKVSSLQRALVKERKEKWKVIGRIKQLKANVSGVFNTNQLYKLSHASRRGTKWSADTIRKGLQLKFACGANGYNLLLAQNQPLPSARSLRRSLEAVPYSPHRVTP